MSELTNRENGLSCHGWLSTKYSQFGSNRLCPPNSTASESKAILYLEMTLSCKHLDFSDSLLIARLTMKFASWRLFCKTDGKTKPWWRTSFMTYGFELINKYNKRRNMKSWRCDTNRITLLVRGWLEPRPQRRWPALSLVLQDYPLVNITKLFNTSCLTSELLCKGYFPALLAPIL